MDSILWAVGIVGGILLCILTITVIAVSAVFCILLIPGVFLIYAGVNVGGFWGGILLILGLGCFVCLFLFFKLAQDSDDDPFKYGHWDDDGHWRSW